MPESFNQPKISVDEYMEQENISELRHEYVQGRVFAMTGSTHAHNVICGNLFVKLHAHLSGNRCSVYMNDMKVWIEKSECFYYPDLLVSCEPMESKSLLVRSPVLVIEVLSPSTAATDRREKLIAYQQISSLREYVIVHQSRPLIELHRSHLNGESLVTLLRKDDELALEFLPDKIFRASVSDIYEGLDLSLLVEEPVESYLLDASFRVP